MEIDNDDRCCSVQGLGGKLSVRMLDDGGCMVVINDGCNSSAIMLHEGDLRKMLKLLTAWLEG